MVQGYAIGPTLNPAWDGIFSEGFPEKVILNREKKYNWEFSKTWEKGEVMAGMGNAVDFGEEEGSQEGSAERESTPGSMWTTWLQYDWNQEHWRLKAGERKYYMYCNVYIL